MTINQKPPQPGRSSLIERAAQTYGLRDMLERGPFRAEPQHQPVAVPPVAGPPASPAVAPAEEPVVRAPLAPLVAAPAPVEMPQPVAAPAAAPVAVEQPYVAPPAHTSIKHNRADVDMQLIRESGFIVPGAPPSVLSEEFRMIKRQILLQAFGSQSVPAMHRGRQILVCSAQPNEGKSFSSVNLALSMVTETDIEVLIIDADVAKPEVLSLLGLPAGPGLMDALADPSIDPEQLVMRTNIPGLLILPAGRQTNNDTELLASTRTRGVLDRLTNANPRRIVIFDSAPALAASPASVLALNVGQILLVVRADVTTESALREALAMLDGGAHIQLLLNGVTFSGSNRKFGHYYGLGDK